MSELSELIEINKKLEAQNKEIIRLLKKIAGESEPANEAEEEIPEAEEVVEKPDIELDGLDVGEVYFVRGDDILKLSIKNNESSINNITGSAEISEFDLGQIVLNEMIKNNASFEVTTVILDESVSGNLPGAIGLCVDSGVKKVYIPMKSSMELLGAPPELQKLIDMDVYKNTENLIEKILNA